MAGYTASAEFTVHKVHQCVLCGAAFGYRLTRSITGQGGTQEQAREALSQNAQTTLEAAVDTHPCPGCGMVQPEMLGSTRNSSHIFQAIAAGVVLLVLAIGMGTHGFHLATGAKIGLGAYGAIALWAYLTATTNPNEDLASSKAKGASEQSAGTVTVHAEGDAANPKLRHPARETDGAPAWGLGLLAAAVVLCATPEALRTVRGEVANERWYPAVVGPGDTATYYFDQRIESLKGYWRGKGAAAIVGEEGLGEDGVLLCEVATKDNDWGQTISVKSSEKRQTSTIYAGITIPGEAALAGKTVSLIARLVYQYPHLTGSNSFEVTDGHIEERPALTLSGPGAGTAYNRNSWLGIMGGGLLLLLGCAGLAVRAGRMTGNPRQTLAVE